MREINRDNLERERDALIGNIRAAFSGVTREGGVSWSEAFKLDLNYSDEECREARALDTDTSWEELIDDPEWDEESGVGGFIFLDAIGTRYYLPAAMIRIVNDGEGDLWLGQEERKYSLFDEEQRNAVKQFLLYMDAIEQRREFPGTIWRAAYNCYWRNA